MWDYTPRQAIAFLRLAQRRHRLEAAEALHIATLGARGDQKALDQQLREWIR